MRRFLPFLMLAGAALFGCGGAQTIPEPRPGEVVFLSQSHPMDEVLERAKQLVPGMRRAQVLALLGRPAFVDAQGWDYVSHDVQGTPVFGPKCWMLHVTFDRDAFVASDLVPAARHAPPAE